MQVPIQITLRGIGSSPSLDVLIREKATKLEHVYDRITSCRVAVEVAGRHKRKGKEFLVRIDLKVPGDEIVVNREHDEDVHIALREAFEVARRQLEEFAQLQRTGKQRSFTQQA